jgi:hypothetical protein
MSTQGQSATRAVHNGWWGQDINTRTVHEGATYTLTVDVSQRMNADGSPREVVTDWYFTSPDGKKTARVCRYSRYEDDHCRWFLQFRPHPTRPRDDQNRHGLQIDWHKPDDTHPSLDVERALWAQAKATAIEWVTKKRVLRGGLVGWCECGWREGMPMHPSTVAKGGAA